MEQMESTDNCQKTYSITLLKKIFIMRENAQKYYIFKILFYLFIKKYNYTVEDGINRLSEYMKENDIRSLFVYAKIGDLIRASVTFKPVVTNRCFDSRVINTPSELEKINLIAQLNTSETLLTHSTCHIVNENELVRYLHALYRHRNSIKRMKDLYYDFSYGFYPVRSYYWINNRLRILYSIVKSEQTFLRFIAKIRLWSPNDFTLEDRILYIESNGMNLSQDQINCYRSLIDIDNRSWWSSGIQTKLLSASAYDDIFYNAVKSKILYSDLNIQIAEWSLNEIKSTVPSTIIADGMTTIDVASPHERYYDSIGEIDISVNDVNESHFNYDTSITNDDNNSYDIVNNDIRDTFIDSYISLESNRGYYNDNSIQLEMAEYDTSYSVENLIEIATNENSSITNFSESLEIVERDAVYLFQTSLATNDRTDSSSFEKYREMLYSKTRFRIFNATQMRKLCSIVKED
jgi:hypothetical protein